MSVYRVVLVAPADSTIEVEADSREDAIDKAYSEHYAGLCHQCAHEVQLGDFEVPDYEWAVELVE